MKNLGSADVLEETRERLLRVQANDRPLWGRMSAAQMVRHLACSCEVALGERPVGPVKVPMPRFLMKWVALRSGLAWPKGLQTTPELIVAIETDTGDFEAGRLAAIERSEEVAEGKRFAPSHPFFSAMSPEDWKRWGYLHADHHLRQFGR